MSSRAKRGVSASYRQRIMSDRQTDVETGLKGYSLLVRHTVWLMGGAVAISVIGALTHNVREFGLMSVFISGNGELVVVAIWGSAFAVWWRAAKMRAVAVWILVGLVLLNLLSGAVLTVLPVTFLPFRPEQSLDHYVSHIVYGVAQLPLILNAF